MLAPDASKLRLPHLRKRSSLASVISATAHLITHIDSETRILIHRVLTALSVTLSMVTVSVNNYVAPRVIYKVDHDRLSTFIRTYCTLIL